MTKPRVPRRDAARFRDAGFILLTLLAAVNMALYPSWLGVAFLIFCAGIAIGAVRATIKHARSGIPATRKALLSALRAIDSQPAFRDEDGYAMWLNRDQHLVFGLKITGWLPGLREVKIARLPEDDVHALFREGAAHIGQEVFRVFPVSLPVYHQMRVETVTTGADGELVYPHYGKQERVAMAWHNFRMEHTGALYAGTEEIRQLISQLGGAEPLPEDDAPQTRD